VGWAGKDVWVSGMGEDLCGREGCVALARDGLLEKEMAGLGYYYCKGKAARGSVDVGLYFEPSGWVEMNLFRVS